jgi:hypothetical protein
VGVWLILCPSLARVRAPSRMETLAEEFGIEYDEVAEGIDRPPPEVADVPSFAVFIDFDPSMVPDRAASRAWGPSEGAMGAAPGGGNGCAALGEGDGRAAPGEGDRRAALGEGEGAGPRAYSPMPAVALHPRSETPSAHLFRFSSASCSGVRLGEWELTGRLVS